LGAVNQLTITGVVPGPLLRFDAVDASEGRAVRTTVYCGYVGLQRNRDFRGIVRAGELEPCAFFVPDSEAYTEPPRLLAVETSLRTIRTMGNPNLVAFGAHDAQVGVVPDPRGTGHSWLQFSFRTVAGSVEDVEINYRVTTQT